VDTILCWRISIPLAAASLPSLCLPAHSVVVLAEHVDDTFASIDKDGGGQLMFDEFSGGNPVILISRSCCKASRVWLGTMESMVEYYVVPWQRHQAWQHGRVLCSAMATAPGLAAW
jgi:hypothetical protein